ncbi:MAG TPA: hypothetical protein VLS96_13850 [Nodosilinea sp.]|nr:hypothetical protein [Nodosilinea sp.]
MVQTAPQPTANTLPDDSYLVVGLATCYLRQEGETLELQVLEPIPSAYLQSVLQGVPTSYSAICGTTLAQAIALDLPEIAAAPAQPCADYEERALAAARTYQSRPEAVNLVPTGTLKRDLNYSTEKKRVLNSQRKISKNDNVKQHKYTHEVL